ncbi:MAG TPA: hypothetical protein VLQ76_07100 [Bacteroidales bacterium]|nr:hypothetical protein [Bacteroidales bacterium]
MKIINRVVTLLFLTLLTFQMQAQEIRAAKTRKLSSHADVGHFLSAVSPDGRTILLSEPGYRGISLMDIRTGNITVINDIQGAGFEPGFTGDGNFIIFKADDFSGVRKLSSLLSFEVATGETRTLLPNTRNLTAPAVSGARIFCLSEGLLISSATGTTALKSYATTDTVLLLEDLTPVINLNGRIKTLKPNGEGSYIWASLSPDKTKVLYYFTGKGTSISDLEGRILAAPGRISAPKWLNNQIIIGMDDRDDGHAVTGSELVCFSLGTNETTYLTSTPSRTEMYPFPLPGGKSVVFQTSEGDLFLMKLRTKL